MKNNKKEVVLEFNLPGFKREDIKVKSSKNSISISAKKKDSKKVQKKDFFHSEKSFRSFNYKTSVPNIDPNNLKVKFNKGVLKIYAPKI